MNVNELKDQVKLSVLEEEANVSGRVKGMNRLELPIKIAQSSIDLLLIRTNPSNVPQVTE